MPVHYEISFENRDHHEARITVHFTGLAPSPLEMRMSRTSPGRYAAHDFAKNVYDVTATNSQGGQLQIERPDPHGWNVVGHNGAVTFSYTVFGNHCDGTYLAIDNTHAHLNMPATFMWAKGHEENDIKIEFHIPEKDWRIATQLAPTQKINIFTAPDMQYFFDSPVELSAFHLEEWEQADKNGSQKFRLALHHEGSAAETKAYAKLCAAVVKEQIAVYGELPQFDYGAYTFIVDYLPLAKGDGMEHRNSTICTSHRSLRDNFIPNLSTLSHELWHAWSVERLRPKALEPFDFEKVNMAGELWFAEGFTSYYDALILKRAGIINIDDYAKVLTRKLNAVLNMPGNRFANPIEMSRQAAFTDAGSSNDAKNFANTYISYYAYGAALGLGLDLMIRQTDPKASLDDLFRKLWEDFGKAEKPYTNKDIENSLAAVTSPTFATEFFRDYISGNNWPSFDELLKQGGLLLRKSKPDEAWLGALHFEFENNEMRVSKATIIGQPLYKAGVNYNDIVLQIDQKSFSSIDSVEDFLAQQKVGAQLEVLFSKNGIERKSKIKLLENPSLEVAPFEHTNLAISDSVKKFRKKWLSSKANLSPSDLQRHCPTCKRAFNFDRKFCQFDGAELKLTRFE